MPEAPDRECPLTTSAIVVRNGYANNRDAPSGINFPVASGARRTINTARVVYGYSGAGKGVDR